MSIGTGQNISSIGATHYVPYSTFQLLDNIIGTCLFVIIAWLVVGFFVMDCKFYWVRLTHSIIGGLALGIILTCSIIRIWL